MYISREALLLLGGVALFAAAVAWFLFERGVVQRRRLEHQIHLLRNAKKQDTNGSKAARVTIKGQVAEQLAPILPGFPYHPSDFRFLGQPIDFICYVGLTEAKEGMGDITEIVIGDIKMGKSQLSPHQRMIKRAVEQGRVRWETIRIDQNFLVQR